MTAPPCALGLDIGGTRLSVALVTADGEVPVLEREATPREMGAAATMEALLRLSRQVLNSSPGTPPVGIGIGFGGPVDYAAQRVRRSHHAPGWADADPAEVLSRELGLPAFLENDANAGGLGEALFGAGERCAEVLYINVGTGVGGAVIIGGRVHHGANSNAGEFGHIVLQPDGPPCPCGKRGCVEALCSGDALGRIARGRVAADRRAACPTGMTGRRVGELAVQGDAFALEIVEESARWMGLAIAGAVNLLDPEVVVIGGGVSELGDVYLQPVRQAFAAHAMSVPAERTRILRAKLGYDAGVIGAAAVALRETNSL